MAAPSLTWKDLGILKDALDEFERTLEDLDMKPVKCHGIPTEVFMVNSCMAQGS